MMKKILSILMVAVMVLTSVSLSSISVMAAETDSIEVIQDGIETDEESFVESWETEVASESLEIDDLETEEESQYIVEETAQSNVEETEQQVSFYSDDDAATVMTASDMIIDSGQCGFCYDMDVRWTLENNGTLIISGEGRMSEYGDSQDYYERPWESYLEEIIKVKIENGITSIGSGAFNGCNNLEEVMISDSVEVIGAYAFGSCYSLESIEIPVSVSYIDGCAFDIGVRKIYYKGTEKQWDEIDSNTFEDSFLEDVTIYFNTSLSPGVYTVARGKCGLWREKTGATWKLTSDGTLTINGSGSTGGYGDNQFGGGQPWESYKEAIISVQIENEVTTIGPWSFAGCINLQRVKLSDSVESICYYAFSDCALTSIEIPVSVKFIDGDAFYHLSDIYYLGTEEQWDKIEKRAPEYDYDYWEKVTVHFNSGASEDIPNYPVIKASNTNGGVNISWSKYEGAAKYRLYRKVSGGSWKKISDVTGTSYTDKNVENGKYYYYTVKAYAGSKWSDYDKNGYQIKYVASPVLKKTEGTTSGIKVTWDKVSGADKYRVYRKESGGTWTNVGDTDSTSYTDKTAVSGKTYYYTVRACNGSVMSGYNGTGITIKYIAAPVLSKAENITTGIKVSWGKVGGASKYRVYRKESGSSKWVNMGDVTGTSYTDKKAESGMTYYYTVKATDGKLWSNYQTPGLKQRYMGTPVLSKVENTTAGVKLTWNKVLRAGKYRVYRKESGGSWAGVGDTTGTSYTDKKAVSGIVYYYTVRATDGTAWSSYDAVGLKLRYMASPVLLKIENTTAGVKVTWGSVSGAEKYRVYRKASDGKWSKLEEIAGRSYTDKSAISGITYSYTVRAVKGTDMGSYETAGIKITYVASPVLSKVENASAGVKVTWSAVKNASKYRVYRKKSGESWVNLKDVADTSYIDPSAVSGTTYYYTVRAVKGAVLGGYDTSGLKITYLASPVLSKAENTATGVKLTWGKAGGASKYRVYRKVFGGNWSSIGDRANTSYTDTTIKEGTTYYYTVRASNGTALSSYDASGIKIKAKLVKIPTTKISGLSAEVEVFEGKSVTLAPVIYPENSTDTIVYSSSNQRIAAVSSGGEVTGKSVGNAVITVKSGSISQKVNVTVLDPNIKVSFDANGGSVSPISKIVHIDNVYGELPIPADREGYSFVGWYTEKDGGDKITSDSALAEKKAHTLYAHWSQGIYLKHHIDTSKHPLNQKDKGYTAAFNNGGCMAVSYAVAFSIITGKDVSPLECWDGTQAYAGTYGSYVNERFVAGSCTKIYNELKSGKPVMIWYDPLGDVYTSHWVTAIGIKAGASPDRLTAADVIIIDPVGGNETTLDNAWKFSEIGNIITFK